MSDEQTTHGEYSIHIEKSTVHGSVLGGQGNTLNVHNYPKPEFPIHYLPLPNFNFTGREEQLAQLHTALNQREAKVAITQTISGLGGVGKTQLALAYAHKYKKEEYPLVWWLDGSDGLTIDLGLQALGRRLNLPLPNKDAEAARQMVLSAVSSMPQRWLLIYDNVDSGVNEAETSNQLTPRTLRPYLPSGAGAVLITSRNQQWDNVAKVLPLQTFTPAESALFWRERLKRLGMSTPEEEVARAELAEALGCLPLALEHAAAYMGEKGRNAAYYLRQYREKRQVLWDKYTKRPNDYHATVATTWQVNFEQVRQTEGAAELLALCAFVAPDDIPLSVMFENLEKGTVENEKLIAVTQLLGDELIRDSAIGALSRYSLLHLNKDGEKGTIHRLVQTIYREEMEKEATKSWVELTIHWLDEAYTFSEQHINTWPPPAYLIPHMQTAIEFANRWKIENKQVASLNNEVGFYLDNYEGKLVAARPYYERTLSIQTKIFGLEHQDTAFSMNNLGSFLHDMGDLEGAKLYLERALAIQTEIVGVDHSDTAMSMGNLARLYQQMGDFEQALPLTHKTLEIYKRLVGDHPSTTTALNNLGLLKQEMKLFSEAQAHYEEALEIDERILRSDHPSTAAILHNLGYLSDAMEDIEMAKSYYERALAIREKEIPNHPDTASSLRNLGGVFRQMNDLVTARSYFERALVVNEKALGLGHPSMALSLTDLAWLSYDENKFSEGIHYMQRAIDIFEKKYGADHPETQTARQSLDTIEAKLAQS